jgi:hypothetical protein
VKSFLVSLVCLFVLFASFGQALKYPALKPQIVSLREIVPRGWTMMDSVSGDLNRDGIKDFALVLQMEDEIPLASDRGETDTTRFRPRILVVLLANGRDGSLRVSEESNTFILCHDNPYMDDPFNGLEIKKECL